MYLYKCFIFFNQSDLKWLLQLINLSKYKNGYKSIGFFSDTELKFGLVVAESNPW